jgi:hypothetical protein
LSPVCFSPFFTGYGRPFTVFPNSVTLIHGIENFTFFPLTDFRYGGYNKRHAPLKGTTIKEPMGKGRKRGY